MFVFVLCGGGLLGCADGHGMLVFMFVVVGGGGDFGLLCCGIVGWRVCLGVGDRGFLGAVCVVSDGVVGLLSGVEADDVVEGHGLYCDDDDDDDDDDDIPGCPWRTGGVG